jgi:hypothetical protein
LIAVATTYIALGPLADCTESGPYLFISCSGFFLWHRSSALSLPTAQGKSMAGSRLEL